MDKIQRDKQLKAAIDEMDKVMGSLRFHKKLNRAWENVKAAIARANKTEGPKQEQLFPGE